MNLNQRIVAMQNEINRINTFQVEGVVVKAIKMRINACTAVLEGRGTDSDKIIARNEMDGRGQDNMVAIMERLENR